MLVFYTHVVWFIGLFTLFLITCLTFIYCAFFGKATYISFYLFSLGSYPLSVSFFFDYMSLSFASVILLISSVIMIYSYNYMYPYSNAPYFIWITFLFVLSMLLVVFISNIFFLMLGWDGLGLVSFFLIVYYQSQSSITSGLFTLLMNRLGDCFFLLAIASYYSYVSGSGFSFTLDVPLFMVSFLLLVTFMTNSALYPFSPWLPLAMAAPTPISALVHSSTLVTAGLYLIMRYSYLVSSNLFLTQLLLAICVFTSFYAGMNSIFEADLKKLIALSTLSHLGFIGIAFFAGLPTLAFFHLLTHALFNSLLFMSIGDIITSMLHSQDVRFLSHGLIYTPSSCAVMSVSLINLLGLPSISGFFSKDLVLETLLFSHSSSFLYFIILLNVGFTYFYTYQLFSFSFQSNKLSSYMNTHSYGVAHSLLLLLIGCSTLLFGFIFLDWISSSTLFFIIPFSQNMFPIALNSLFFIGLLSYGSLWSPNGASAWSYFSSIIGLSSICLSVSSSIFYKVVYTSVRSVELGGLSYSFNTYTSNCVVSLFKTFMLGVGVPGLWSVLGVSMFLVFSVIMFCVT